MLEIAGALTIFFSFYVIFTHSTYFAAVSARAANDVSRT